MVVVPRTPIGSGEFLVARARPEFLYACLGSCVGVAIVDRRAQVGGLIHLLLPDDVAAGNAFGAATSAKTGIPLFLGELTAAGGSATAMEATVAGGSLVGRVSPIDLDLDIGGRTVEVVNGLLKEAGIPVIASETGGHYGAKLVLHLETLTTTIEPLFEEEVASVGPPPRLLPGELDRAISRLTPIPQAALKIIRMLQDDDYGLLQLADELRRDQVLTARVIKACNAAYLGARDEIQSIEHALLLLGGRVVGQLILSSAMGSFYGNHARGYSMTRGGLYHHAVSTAIVSEQIAAITQAVPRDLAYTAGLLHDVGKVLLDQHVASARPLFYREVVLAGTDLRDVERAVLGVSHDEAGARLAEAWSFPRALRNAIAHHTHPGEAAADQTLTHLVYLADLLVLRFNVGHDLDRLGVDHVADALGHLGLEPDGLPGLVGRINWKALLTPGYF